MSKAREWEGVDWGVYALGRSSFLCLDLARVPTGVVIGVQRRHRCNAWALVTCSTIYFKPAPQLDPLHVPQTCPRDSLQRFCWHYFALSFYVGPRFCERRSRSG